MLYKKGDPRDESNYRPIAISTCMYQIPAKMILRGINKPLTEVLFEHQAGGRRGHTTLPRAIKVWSSALSMLEHRTWCSFVYRSAILGLPLTIPASTLSP